MHMKLMENQSAQAGKHASRQQGTRLERGLEVVWTSSTAYLFWDHCFCFLISVLLELSVRVEKACG